jgi:hypothetical protein
MVLKFFQKHENLKEGKCITLLNRKLMLEPSIFMSDGETKALATLFQLSSYYNYNMKSEIRVISHI